MQGGAMRTKDHFDAMKTALPGAVLVALILSSTLASASPGELYGAGARAIGTAGVATALVEDGTAAFYNPAGLGIGAASGKVSLSLGYFAGMPFMGIRRQSDDEARLAAFPTQMPSSQGFVGFSALFPLGGKLANHVGLGLMIHHPQDKLMSVRVLEPRLPQWPRYDGSSDRFELAAGFGIRFSDQLSVGLGMTALAGLGGTVDFAIDLFSRQMQRRSIDFALKEVISPIVGVTFTPFEALRIAANYRGDMIVPISQPNAIDLGDLGQMVLDVTGFSHYSPHQIALAVAYSATTNLRLTLEGKLDLWSLSPFPAMSVGVDMKGEVPEALGLDRVMSFDTKDPAAGFRNTVTPGAAFEYTFPDGATRMRGGYAFRPSYIPDQIRPWSNFLDNNAHLFGIGATFQFHDPLEVFSRPMKFDVGAQGHVMQRRYVNKEQGRADPVGDYSFGGGALALAAGVRYEF